MRLDVVFATHRRAPDLDPDDEPLGAECSRLGLSWRAVPWDDGRFDWSSARMVVLRSPWDYTRRRDEFLGWARRVSAVAALHNPLEVVERNSEKSYLIELARRGVPVVPTEIVEPGQAADLGALMRERGWGEVVVKPAVSAGSWRTWRVRADEPSHAWTRARRLLSTRRSLVQPFLPSVVESGERALVFLDGELTHAIRKRSVFEPPDVPFRVPVEPADDERRLAIRALETMGAQGLLYARVDLVRDHDGRAVVIELELTEPRLFLGVAPPDAASRMARGIARRLG